MKLKLDLHDIFSDGHKIESALQDIIEQAVSKRAAEVEIIPGKGSGALKKSVLRFLERPEIKSQYHRIDKDSDNWGRLFVYFRHSDNQNVKASANASETTLYTCFCCSASNKITCDSALLLDTGPESRLLECPSCGSPNRLRIRADKHKNVYVTAVSGYE